MDFKKIFLLSCCFSLASLEAGAQTSERSISIALPYLLTRPDARSSAMGDVGVATSADAYSLYANPSKIAFITSANAAGLSYVPLLPYLANDVRLANFAGFRKVGERGVVGLSIYYLSYGQVDGRDNNNVPLGMIYPSEYTIDFTYVRKMANNFSMGLTGRFLHSDLYGGSSSNNVVVDPVSAFAADVSTYYEKDQLNGLNGKWAFGAVISNIGTKVRYTDNKTQFLPTNLKIGTAYSFLLDKSAQKLTLSMDMYKLLVPTPPQYDSNGQITAGRDPNISVVSALFSSFADAPGGFSEELREVCMGVGVEYLYDETFAVRTGYFYENPEKGNRQHLGLGTGLKYKNFNFDLGYVIPTSNRYILKNSMKFSLAYGF